MKKSFSRFLCLFLVCGLLLSVAGCAVQLPRELEQMLGLSPKEPVFPPVDATVETEPTVPPTTQDPNPVPETNPYRDYYDVSTGYILPESNARYFFRSELTHTDKDWLRLARNEIFARHGYVFEDPELAEYFESMSWYTPNPGKNPEKDFNKYESHNVTLLGAIEDILNRKKVSLSGKYLEYYDPNVEYILPESHDKALDEEDLEGLSKEQLKLARNEIFARHGYWFSNADLLKYFAFCSWYRPDKSKDSTGKLNLKSVENKNVSLIQDFEKNPPFSAEGLSTKLNYTVKNDYFSIKLPAYWKDSCTVDKYQSWIIFSQTKSLEDYGGFLFDVGLVESVDEIDYHPSFRILGILENSNGESYYVVVTEPTDVQFDTEDRFISGQYMYMYDEQERIVKTIKGLNGFDFYAW